MVTPHDDLFHFVFQHPRHAAAWLRSVLPGAIVAAIRWQSLAPAPDKLRGQTLRLSVADLVFQAEHRHTRTPLWIVVEHKAHADPGVEAQVLRYVVSLRDRSPRPDAPVPIDVVPVLLHHGEAPFVVHAPQDGCAVAALRPRLPLLFDDLAATTEADLLRRPQTPLGTLTLLCLRSLRGMSATQALAAFQRWAWLLRATDRDEAPPLGPDAIAAIARYALRTVEVEHGHLHETFEHLLQRREETIMSTAERLHREGKAEGLVEGRAAILVRQLTRRFGPLPRATAERLLGASIAELDRWAERVLDAGSLAEVFAAD